MKKMSKKSVLLILAGILIVVAVLLYFLAPPYLYSKAMEDLRKEAGLTKKTVSVEGFDIVYLEGGLGDPMVLLHGFGANKDNWLRFAKQFTSDYRVIIPDLPGFGESSQPQNASYMFDKQVKRFKGFMDKLGVQSVHLAGSSMGGTIAAVYAGHYPDQVKTLVLFDAAGIASPVPSERELMMERGDNVFIVRDAKDYKRLLDMNFFTPLELPSVIVKYLAKESIKAAPLQKKIYDEISAMDSGAFLETLSKIQAPTLVVWGDSDKILHISAMPIFVENIQNAKSAVIKESGHLPMMEKPEESAALYKDFLDENRER